MQKYLLPKSRIILWVILSIICFVFGLYAAKSVSINPLGLITVIFMTAALGFVVFIIEQIFLYRREINHQVSRQVIAFVGLCIIPICAISGVIGTLLGLGLR